MNKFIMPVLLLAIIATVGIGQVEINKVYACGMDDISSCFGGIGTTSPYLEGVQDGIYDHQHGLIYNPVGQCETCSGEDFQNGYTAGWSQSQESNQGAEVNVVNSPGAQVSVNQGSNQQQQGPSVGCDNSCGGGPCLDSCGQGACDYGCGFHHWFHHFGCGFNCGYGYRHIGFADP